MGFIIFWIQLKLYAALHLGCLMIRQTYTVVIFAILAAFGLITVIAVDIVLSAQEAEAAGCRTSQAVNASKGRCIKD